MTTPRIISGTGRFSDVEEVIRRGAPMMMAVGDVADCESTPRRCTHPQKGTLRARVLEAVIAAGPNGKVDVKAIARVLQCTRQNVSFHLSRLQDELRLKSRKKRKRRATR